jgi:hypothetical protein
MSAGRVEDDGDRQHKFSDLLGVKNAARQIRAFDAAPADTLELLRQPL